MGIENRVMSIPDGPLAGWDIAVSHVEHGVDAMDDQYTLDLWPPDADQPGHSFATYRHGYGWNVINAALSADGFAEKQMKAALNWWNDNQHSTFYEIHRILVAIDDTTWATCDEITQRLRLTLDDLHPGNPNGKALATAEQHGLLTWRNQRTTPYAALTPAGYDLIHPDDQHAGIASQQQLQAALAASQQKDHAPAPPAAGKAFPAVNHIAAQPTSAPVDPALTAPAPARSATR